MCVFRHLSSLVLLMRAKRMAFNLTLQVRSIASVTKAVAAGDLSQTVNVEVEGEVLELKMTVNGMVEQVCSVSCLFLVRN